jgi:hypothetical protein
MGNGGNMMRVQRELPQSILELLADMLHEIRLIHAREQVRPDGVLFACKIDLLAFSGIF